MSGQDRPPFFILNPGLWCHEAIEGWMTFSAQPDEDNWFCSKIYISVKVWESTSGFPSAGFASWINTEQKLVQCQGLGSTPKFNICSLTDKFSCGELPVWSITLIRSSPQPGPRALQTVNARRMGNALLQNTRPPVAKAWANERAVIW